jgi:hypothetical protein
VLCLPAFSEADRVAGEVLARHLASIGVDAEVVSGATLVPDATERAVEGGVETACIVALPPFAALRARYALRRARIQGPDLRLVAIVLDPAADRDRVDAALRHAGADETAFSLVEALKALVPPVIDPVARKSSREPAADPLPAGGPAASGRLP